MKTCNFWLCVRGSGGTRMTFWPFLIRRVCDSNDFSRVNSIFKGCFCTKSWYHASIISLCHLGSKTTLLPFPDLKFGIWILERSFFPTFPAPHPTSSLSPRTENLWSKGENLIGLQFSNSNTKRCGVMHVRFSRKPIIRSLSVYVRDCASLRKMRNRFWFLTRRHKTSAAEISLKIDTHKHTT